MALFKRNEPDIDTVPQEVQEYYQAENRQRPAMAWLMALGTLVVTLLLAAGLFLGGRWIYRTVTDKGGDTTTSQTKPSENTGTSSTSTSTPSTGTTPDSTTSTGSSSTQSTTTNTTPPATDSSQSAATDADLANTGPADTFAVFAVTTIAGVFLYRVVWLRRTI